MIGLSEYYVVSCDKCAKGIDLRTAMMLQKHQRLDQLYECQCGNKFSYVEGIINGFCCDISVSQYEFISDIWERGEAEIVVGRTFIVKTKNKCWINKVHLNQAGVWLTAVVEGADTFKILSSEIENHNGKTPSYFPRIGDKYKVSWSIQGRSYKYPIETWNEFLIKAKEQIINQEFLLSYFSSAAALESFLNLQIDKDLREKKVNDDAIGIFLKESSFPDKIFKLSKSVLGIELDTNQRKALQKIIETRNVIAHGKNTTIEMDQAKECFKAVVTVIFKYLNKHIS